MQKRHTIDYRWDPDLDLNGLGPLVIDPIHPTRPTRRRHRLLLDMLLEVGDVDTVRDILAAYPYLQTEYGARVARAEQEEAMFQYQSRSMSRVHFARQVGW